MNEIKSYEDMTLLAYHGDPAIKDKYLARVRHHRALDQLVQGIGWDIDSGRGCAVGCVLEDYNHQRYSAELGLPVWLAYVEDRIFEGLPQDRAMEWPEQLLSAIRVGADLEPVRHQLCVRRMDRLIAAQTVTLAQPDIHGLHAVVKEVRSALKIVRSCFGAGMGGNVCDWSAAAVESAARSAAVAESAAKLGVASRAAKSMKSAAWAAEEALVWGPESEAASAAWAVWAWVWAAAESEKSAAQAAWQQEADALIELLQAA